MLSKTSISIAILFLVTFVGIFWLTMPSETQMIEHTATQIVNQVAAHTSDCEHCNDVPDRKAVAEGIRTRMISSGVKYRSYIFFSVLTSDGLAEAQAIGILGKTFGPAAPPYICPNDIVLDVPDFESMEDIAADTTVKFEVHTDGTCHADGQQMTEQELSEYLTNEKDAGRTSLIISANKKTKYRDLDRFKKVASEVGFDSIHIGILEDDEDE